jgi:hypothetical protein
MISIARVGLLTTAIVAASAYPGGQTRLVPPPPATRTIVLAELFTSEGCSSCPPADTLLGQLLADQPIPGVEVVALGHHVDYWDGQGWRDPFSSALASRRQSSYSDNAFHLDSIYTPQIVVDGMLESTGTDAAAVRRNILKAAQEPKANVEVSTTPATDAAVGVTVRVQLPDQLKRKGKADVLIAVTEDGLVSRVQYGENRGRTLSHSAVVRLLTTVSHVNPRDQTASGALDVKLGKDWDRAHLRVVAFVQEESSRRILGTGETPLMVRR